MKFNDLYIFRDERFSIGQETDSNYYFLSIPVSSGLAEHEEYYKLTPEEFNDFSNCLDEMRKLASECRARNQDNRLVMKPGSKRGEPI